jgi:hypothetical protein
MLPSSSWQRTEIFDTRVPFPCPRRRSHIPVDVERADSPKTLQTRQSTEIYLNIIGKIRAVAGSGDYISKQRAQSLIKTVGGTSFSSWANNKLELLDICP